MQTPEQQIVKAGVLNAKNLYKLLVFMRNIYPIGYSYEGLKKELNIKIFTPSNLTELRRDGLIRERDLPTEIKSKFNKNFAKFYPEYIITTKGMEFINSIDTYKLSKKIERLTWIITGLTTSLIGLGILQIVLSL